MMGSIMRPNSPHTVAQLVDANSIMGKMTLCQFLHAHINVFVPLLVCVCVCGREVATLLQTVQIYLYANWILVKPAVGLPTSHLVKLSWS